MTRLEPSGRTREQILDAAERRVQALGFNGFSYADIAHEVGISNASIHYHFPTKGDLGLRLVERYKERFHAALVDIEAKRGPVCDRLRDYVGLYEGVLAADRLCLCGIMASEYATLPLPVRAELVCFFELNQTWLAAQLNAGRDAGDIAFDGQPLEVAIALVSALEGAMLVARLMGGLCTFRSSAEIILANICPSSSSNP